MARLAAATHKTKGWPSLDQKPPSREEEGHEHERTFLLMLSSPREVSPSQSLVGQTNDIFDHHDNNDDNDNDDDNSDDDYDHDNYNYKPTLAGKKTFKIPILHPRPSPPPPPISKREEQEEKEETSQALTTTTTTTETKAMTCTGRSHGAWNHAFFCCGKPNDDNHEASGGGWSSICSWCCHQHEQKPPSPHGSCSHVRTVPLLWNDPD